MARGGGKEKRVADRVGTGKAKAHRLQLGEATDAEVVQASLDGDSRAFSELVRRYDQRLLNFIYRTIGDRERGELHVPDDHLRLRSVRGRRR